MATFIGNTQVRVHLTAKTLVACELERSRWRRTVVTRKARFAFAPGERATAMEKLSQWLQQGAPQRSITWIIGTAHAGYFVLPWSPALIDRGLRDTYARAHFEQFYERDADGASFSFSPTTPGGRQLVSWVPAELPLELAAHARRAGCELTSIKPAILSVWDRFRDVLEPESSAFRIGNITVSPRGLAQSAAARLGALIRRFSSESTPWPADVWADEPGLQALKGSASTRDRVPVFALFSTP